MLLQEMRCFFGPSKLFQPVFKRALLHSVEMSLQKKEFKLTSEPLFNQIIETMVIGQLASLRKKARIMIQDSCVLIGVADQLGILEEG